MNEYNYFNPIMLTFLFWSNTSHTNIGVFLHRLTHYWFSIYW